MITPSRVAIVDFDVHHGNVTEDIVEHLRPRTIRNISTSLEFGTRIEKRVIHKPW